MRNTLGWLLGLALITTPAAAQVPERGAWTRLTPPSLIESFGVFDPVRNRVLILPFGRYSAPDEQWVLELDHPDRWRRIYAGGSAPPFDFVRAVIYDPRFDRVLAITRDPAIHVTGPTRLTVFELPLAPGGQWRELGPPTTGPTDRGDFSLIYDSRRERFVLFGGGEPYRLPRWNEVWRLDAGSDHATWEQLHPGGFPILPRSGAGAIYDAARDRMVLFGGAVSFTDTGGQDRSDDVAALDFSPSPSWSFQPGSGQFNAMTDAAACLYDPPADRMIVFPRHSYSTPVRALALADLTSWSVYDTTGTQGPQIQGMYAAPDPTRGRGIVLSLTHAVHEAPLAPPGVLRRLDPGDDRIPTEPFASVDLTHVPTFVDTKDGSILIWGGFSTADPAYARRLWRFAPDTFPHWSVQSIQGPVPAGRFGAATAYDHRRDRWLVFGGWSHDTLGTMFGDTWAFDPKTLRWSPVASPSGPGARNSAAMAYDGIGDRLVLHGGALSGQPTPATDTWVLPLSGTGGWQQLETSGPQPHYRTGASAVWDPASDRFLLFGGVWWRGSGVVEPSRVLPGDTWALGLDGEAHWDSLATDPKNPIASADHFAYYDAVRGRMGVIGGVARTTGFLALPLAALRELALEDVPGWTVPAVEGSSGGSRAAAFDPLRDRLITFSGSGLDQAWALEGGRPVVLAPLDFEPGDPTNGLRPDAHGTVTAAILGTPVFDASQVDPASVSLEGAPARAASASDRSSLRDVNGDGLPDRVLRFDGSRLALDPSRPVVRLAGRLRTGEALVAYDAAHFAGALDRTPVAASGDPDSPTDTVVPLRLVAFAPSPGRARLGLSLPRASAVMLEVYSVSGRRVLVRDLGVLAAGSHDLPVELGREMRAGVFFARVTVGAEVLRAKFVVLP